jgi:HK97 family phage prohead protease
MENQTEYRVVRDGELRAAGDLRVTGYAAVFDTPSLPLREHAHSFTETVRKGAFARTIAQDDIRALFSHDDSKILGRTKAKTLRLVEDQVGLHADISLPNTTLGKDVHESVRRGDISGMSFRFQMRKDNWSRGGEQRELLDVQLTEISLVAFPAYPATTAEARSVGLPSDADVLVYAGVTPMPVCDEERRRLELRLDFLRRL